MSGYTSQDRIRIGSIREKVDVVLTVEKMVKFRFKWFGYVWKRPTEATVRRVN